MCEKMHKLVSFARNPVILLEKSEIGEPRFYSERGTLVPKMLIFTGLKSRASIAYESLPDEVSLPSYFAIFSRRWVL